MTSLIRNIELHSCINYAMSMPRTYTIVNQEVEISQYSNILRCYLIVPQIDVYIYIYHQVTAKANFPLRHDLTE